MHRFWAGPITIVLGNFALDNWVREKAANGIENTVAFVGFAMFLVSDKKYAFGVECKDLMSIAQYLTRPSAANINFPYHVRTTQISVINETADSKHVRL